MKKQKIKTELKYEDITILLYEPIDGREMPDHSISNIVALDSMGRTIWRAETPKSSLDQYWDIQLDSVNNTLIATTALSFRHVISLKNGEILHWSLVK